MIVFCFLLDQLVLTVKSNAILFVPVDYFYLKDRQLNISNKYVKFPPLLCQCIISDYNEVTSEIHKEMICYSSLFISI